MRSHGCFSIGGVLSTVWAPSQSLLPWALPSALLSVAGTWDYMTLGRPIEWIVMGLAAYELMIGLLEQDARTVPVECRGE